MFRRGLQLAVSIAAVSLFLGFTACTKSNNAEKYAKEGILNIGNGGEPKDLDPAIVTGVPEHHILHNIFEPLVSKDPKTLAAIPGAAESWEISKDGTIYTFKIRKNLKWSNGEPCTAHDYAYSIVRLLKPETASEYAYQGYYIKNAKALNEKKITDASQVGVKAIDDHTLQITLDHATPFYLGLLYHHSYYPVHKATVEKHGPKWTRPENIVTNGAFKISKWEMNKVITLEPNAHYWDVASIKLKKVNFFPVENQDTEEKMYRSGELHVTNEIPLEKLPTWQKGPKPDYIQSPFLATYYYWFNVNKKPLDNKKVRTALALAVDRDKLVKYVTKGGQLPGRHQVPPGSGGNYNPPALLPGDLSELPKAKQLLAEAGYPDGKGFPAIELLYNTSENHKKIAEALQEMWKQNLGIDVKLFNQEWKVYLNTQQSGNFQMSRAGWVGDYNDPNTFLDMFVTGQGTNYGGWSNKEYDGLIKAAGQERDLSKRLDIFKQAETILLNELPVIPLYIYTRVYLRNPMVQGWHENVEDIHPVRWVSFATQP